MSRSNQSNPFNGNGSNHTNGHYSGENLRNITGIPDDEEEIDIKKIIYLLFHHKYLIISVVLLFSVIAGILAFETTPVYQSDGTILITNASHNNYSMAGSDISNMLTSVYGIGIGNDVQDEIQVLQSRTLANDVAKKLREEYIQPDGRVYPILWRGYPEDSSLVSIDTVAQRIETNLSINRLDQQSDAVKITFNGYSPYEAAHVVDLVMSTYSKLSTEQNRTMASSALDFLKNETARIKVRLDTAETNLQRFMNHTKLVDLDDQSQQLIQTMSQLETSREELEVNRVAANTAIQTYTAQLDSLRPGLPRQYAEALAPTLTRYQYRLAELQTKKMLLISRNPNLKTGLDSVPELININRQISLLQKQIGQMTAKMVSKDNLRYLGFLGTSSGDIGQQVVDLDKNLIQAQIRKKQYDAQAKVLDTQIAKLNAFFDRLPNNMIQLARHKMEVSINQQLYVTVAQQAADMALWEQTQGGMARIVDHGVIPTHPIKPKKRIYVLIGFLIGFVLSVGYIFVKDSYATQITSTEHLRKLGPPVLAVIPDMTNTIKRDFSGQEYITERAFKISTSLLTLLDSISPVAESFRRLQANIIYSQPDIPLKVLAITSVAKSEGKTMLAGNLAIALSESGKKVLIIDCDFRRPRQHELFGISSSNGLMDVLFDNCEREYAIKETILRNVYVIPVGKRPPNPAAVSQSARLMDLIRSLKSDFDFIILDTAPYGIINDATSLIKMADGVVVTARFNVTHEPNLEQTLNSLEHIHANVLGTVLQAFDYSKSTDYYYYRGYYKYAYHNYFESYDKARDI